MNEQLLRALGDVDVKYIIEAAPAQGDRKRKGFGKTAVWAAAACIAVMLLAGWQVFLRFAPIDEISPLPQLTVTHGETGMGFEGYMAYDISELVNGNPWSESEDIKTLPVYKNPLTYGEYNTADGVDPAAMRATLLDIAARLGMDTGSLVVTDDAPGAQEQADITANADKYFPGGAVPDGFFNPTVIKTESDGVKIEVGRELTAFVVFKQPIALPDGYNFTENATYEEALSAAQYLKNEYAMLAGMNDPQVIVSGGDYSFYLQRRYSIELFDSGADIADRIVNYNFNRMKLYRNSEGELSSFRIFAPDLSEKTGDYPIISTADARELLLSGNYITTAPSEMPGEEFIAKTELVYRSGAGDVYFMPYYRFYVELPEFERDGLKTYGAYYVPAVDGEYITNMPMWDGSFN